MNHAVGDFEIDKYAPTYEDNDLVGHILAVCSISISSDDAVISFTTTIIVSQFGDTPWPVRGPHYWACAQVLLKLPPAYGQWFHFSPWSKVDICTP